ncbi:MAG TPA: CHAP domain-containing protein [Sphingobacterium sp.]|nr:CHAP domain-containing protein [Sphingobacterium sp.]
MGTGDGAVETQHLASLRNRILNTGAGLQTRDHNAIRTHILKIAQNEIGVREATGRNDGKRVEEYLRYTHLGKGYEWCAAFVSWCYGQAGLSQPRNPWSPALFPNARTYWKGNVHVVPPLGAKETDIFGIYSPSAKRISHVGLFKEQQGQYLLTIEGNSNNRVESRRRHLSTVYALSDWVTK